MQAFFSRLQTLVEEQLRFVHSKYTKEQQAEEACKILRVAYARLESFELRHYFGSPEEEITYFKTLKPQLSGKLIYYARVHRIEMEKPNGSAKVRKDYLLCELEKIYLYSEENIGFICYYEANESYRDELYFRRKSGKGEANMPLTGPEMNSKETWSNKVAQIIANDLLQTYLREQLRLLSEDIRPEIASPSVELKLTWTESKASLVELIYSIQRTQALNHGKVDIKDLAEFFQKSFHIDLGDYYRAYRSMQLRKTGRTKFLDSLKENFLLHMDEQEQN